MRAQLKSKRGPILSPTPLGFEPQTPGTESQCAISFFSFYTYTQMPPVFKSRPKTALKLHKHIETILGTIGALQLAQYKINALYIKEC